MADSLLTQIIAKINTCFAGILVSGGYATNLGSNINWWRDLENNPFQASELPAANCKDASDDISPMAMNVDGYKITILLNVFCATIAAIRSAISDIVKASNVDITWGGLAYDTEIVSNEIEVEQKENKYFSNFITMEVYFNTVAGDPYTPA